MGIEVLSLAQFYWGGVDDLQSADSDSDWLAVDIREIKELRLGKASRDFERYPEEARKLDPALCFIVLYGLEFRLKTLSVAGPSPRLAPPAALAPSSPPSPPRLLVCYWVTLTASTYCIRII